MSLFRDPPETRYADTGNGLIGYQVFGEGPANIVVVAAPDSNVEIVWERREFAQFFDRLASFARVALYDSRGHGISDAAPDRRLGSLEIWNEDIAAVIDVARFESAVLLGARESGPLALQFAAARPERVSGLVLLNTYARFARDVDYPIGMPSDTLRELFDRLTPLWGQPGFYVGASPSLEGRVDLNRWLARLQRLSMSPSSVEMLKSAYYEVDVRGVLDSIQTATLVLARSDAAFHRPDHGRFLADRIADAELVLLPGADTSPFWVGDSGPVLDEIERFVAGHRDPPVTSRVFASVLFTDIVDSTSRAAQIGDDQWLDLLEDHNRIAHRAVDRYDGQLVKHTGDGILATFDGPSKAILCAIELQKRLDSIDLPTRAGLHAGEIETAPNGDIGGVAVHIASRVMSELDGPGIAITRTVKELVAGSDIRTEPIGDRTLKGLAGPWELHRVVGA